MLTKQANELVMLRAALKEKEEQGKELEERIAKISSELHQLRKANFVASQILEALSNSFRN